MRIAISRLSGGWIPLVVITILLAVLPLVGVPRAWLLYLFLFFIYLALANMWNLLAGYSGLISLCQPAFIGLAGYTLVIFTWSGLPPYLGVIAGAIVAAIFAIIISIPVFRLSGVYFAIGTLIIPEVLRIVFFLWRPVGGALHGGGAGYMIKGVTGVSLTDIYFPALVVGIASIFLMRLILNSKLGLGLAAIRDSNRTAASAGINVFNLKLSSFVIGAFVTGLAGAIFYIYQGYIEPASAFNIKWTLILMLSTVIGGIGIQGGPVVGTIIVVILHFLLARYAGVSLLIQGVILIVIMLLAPAGLLGFVRNTRPYRFLARFFGRL